MNTLAHHPDSFQRFILFSIVAHIGLVIFLKLPTLIFTPGEDIIIKKAIRVDIVALPEKEVAPPPKVTTSSPPPKVNVRPKTQKRPKPNVKKAQQEALKKLQMMSAVDKIKQQLEQEEANKRAQEYEKKIQQEKKYAGNVITKGTHLDGLDQLSMNEYYAQLEEHIHNYWFLPQWLDELNLRAQALVQIESDGHVVAKQLYLSSGNSVFDETVLKTIEKASPFPPPPDRLKSVLKNNGFVLNFPN